MGLENPARRPARLLLAVYADVGKIRTLSLDDWDLVVRVARGAKLLAALYARVEQAALLPELPEAVRQAMESEMAIARFRDQMARVELWRVARSLKPLNIPILLLKGAAYLAEGLGIARGRLVADVDVLVPREQLDAAERTLVEAGWRPADLDPHDQRYYREWSHELPPMRFPEHPLELDVHHSILPVTSRLRPVSAALFGASRASALEGFRVLCREDQVLHACVHLFQDSDLANRVRDLADIDGLVREYSRLEGFWDRLLARSRLHGLDRPLWYSLRFAAVLLGTSIPAHVIDSLAAAGPSRIARWAMHRLVPLALLPSHPDRRPPVVVSLSRAAMRARYQLLRLPPFLLVAHTVEKMSRGVRTKLLAKAPTGAHSPKA